MKGLFICPTPIGNLEDITIRTIKTLKKVDLIACEDTRTSRKLLNRYNIKTRLTSYHKFNYKSKIPELIEFLKKGKSLGLISDAGMPGISDPGVEMVRSCIEEGLDVRVLPGASASLVALVLSGLDTERFTFIGFLSEKSNKRKKELEEIKNFKESLIFYEAPHRLLDTLIDMQDILGNRKMAICRELTKIYEEVIRGDLDFILERVSQLKIKGEFVLVVEGFREEDNEVDIKEELTQLLFQGFTKKEAVEAISKKYDLRKNEVYRISLEL